MQPSRDQRALFLIVRHDMRLEPVFDLQNMFEPPQEFVRAEKLGELLAFEIAAIGKPIKALECMGCAKPSVAAAVSKLEGLRNKLDLSDPAPTKLDIGGVFTGPQIDLLL